MFQTIQESIYNALRQFSNTDLASEKGKISVDKPKNPDFGDLFTNAAMVFSKALKVSPQVLAKAICESLMQNENVVNAEIAGPGFVNIQIKPKFWQDVVSGIIRKGKDYAYFDTKSGETINVEFVSANPTGPLHTGHARNAVFGSVVSNLFKRLGYNVVKEFYVNDKGNQIKSLARSLYLRYKQALGIEVLESEFSEDMYCGAYLVDLAKEIVDIYQDEFLNKDESEWIDFFKEFSVKKMLENIEQDLSLLGIKMDIYTSEADVCKRKLVEEAIAILSKKGDIYEGILPQPKGMVVEDWEERPQTLFRSTKHGDDIDRPIKKSDGTWTYFAGDMAYHLDKFKRGFSHMVDIFGADHNGYVKRLKAAVSALSDGKADVEIRMYQLVNFLENGKPVRMSKRSGNFITLKDVVNRVGKDVTRYMMISRHHDVTIDFDFVKAVEFSMENPLFYIQYAYARICSVFRNFESNFGHIDQSELLSCSKEVLNDDAEILLIKALSFWPEQIKNTALAIEPHRLPIYLQEIAYLFHSLWNKGKTNSELRFIDPNSKEFSLARLALLSAVKMVIEDGFDLIGIEPMSEMK